MAERWVLNASPLIVLCKINHQHLIEQLAGDILVPKAVLAEINAGPADDPARLFLSDEPFPVDAVDVESQVFAWDLGAGESAVLNYALNHPGWKAVIDDGAGSPCSSRVRHTGDRHTGHYYSRTARKSYTGDRSGVERPTGRWFSS